MDSERLTEIFEKMRQKLQRAARAIVGDADEAEDAVQDVFCTLWSRRTLIRDNGLYFGFVSTPASVKT